MTAVQFAWRSPPPSSIDERLAVAGGEAWLVVCSPIRDDGSVGTFRAEAPDEDRSVLEAAGPGEHVFDVLAPGGDPLRAAAQRVAELAHGHPVAVAQFGAAAIVRAGAPPIVSLTVTGVGTDAVEFHIDPGRLTVQFAADDQTLGWQPVPAPGMGFMTTEADLLGGVGLGATVPPDEFGAIALSTGVPPTATKVLVGVSGTLHVAVAGERLDAHFAVRTPWSEVHRETA